jgi:hypothetical protein
LGLVFALFFGLNAALADSSISRPSVAEILDFHDIRENPANRAEAVREIRALQENAREAAHSLAQQRGMPVRLPLPDGGVKEVQAVDDDGELIYYFTHNDMAAVSTGADILRLAPWNLRGEGLRVGMWDGGAGRSTHQEFAGGRMINMDNVASIDHATHVGGTLAAAGVVARAQGMAPEVVVESFDWNDDKAQMIDRAASGVNDPDGLYISNHSYGIVTGWFRTGGTNPAFIWYGSGTTTSSIDPRFGTYNTFARDTDAIAYDAPYYLIVRSAGNDRTDNPAAGQIVQLSPSSTSTVTYDPALHPAGDGIYRNGFDTLGFDAVAKNALTVGSVTDAVSDGVRDPSVATVSNFSSWGPTDDGRIKPDVVANGQGVYSTRNGDTAYSTLSGTSMSAPNATGAALLLIDQFRRLFPGQNMRSSTLRGLLIHTADDLGTPGPNYSYGWGLINGVRAAELITDHAAHPERLRLTESVITPGNPSFVHEFVWDGTSPIRATLAWTDPAGTATTTGDLRSPRLRNNLDLRIIGPDNTVYQPFVMPFVGTWTVESMALPATTGVNNTDNVEQVLITAPTEPGVYRVEVTYQGTLVDNQQVFSLLLDGSTGDEPPPPPLAILEISPAVAFGGSAFTMTLGGRSLELAEAVRLERTDAATIHATNLRMSGTNLLADFDLAGAASGLWDVAASSPEETSVLADAFTVRGAIWSEDFDGPSVIGWTSQVIGNIGSNSWTLTTNNPHSAPNAYTIPGTTARSQTALVSPIIPVPSGASNLQLRFWHRYEMNNRTHGGRLEYSVNGGTNWAPVVNQGGTVRFISNGYNNTIRSGGGNPNTLNPFGANTPVWTGNSGGYIETVVNFTSDSEVAGKDLRLRWLFATDSSNNASPGWTVDSMVILAEGDIGNQAPVIVEPVTVPGAATETINAGTEDEQVRFLIDAVSAPLTVVAMDDGGTAQLTYNWTASGPAPVFFLANNSNEADSTEAFFEVAGIYQINVSVTDSQGLSTVSTAFLNVRSQPSGVTITPASASLDLGATLAFSATLIDQFNQVVSTDPALFAWSASAGTISAAGFYEATAAGENITTTASTTSGETLFGSAQITVLQAQATVILDGLEAIFDGEPKPVTVTTIPAGLAVSVTYDGSPDVPSAIGEYAVEAIVTDPNYSGIATDTLVIAEAVSPDAEAFEAWIEGFDLMGEDAHPDADPDGDGLSNYVEWLFDFDPSDPNDTLKATLERTSEGFVLRINRVITKGTFVILESTNLVDWTTVATLEIEEKADAHPVSLDDWTTSSDPFRFLRLRYTPPDRNF